MTADRERIQAHLAEVETELRAKDVSHLSADLQSERLRNIERLHEYRLAGIFPQNSYVSDRSPVFIDAQGRACAVGYLIIESGHEDAARRIASRENLARLPDMQSPEVAAWLARSGLTAAEAALIQPSYSSIYCGQDCPCSLDGSDETRPVCDADGTSWLNRCVARACGAPGPYEFGCCASTDVLQLPDGVETGPDAGSADAGNVNGFCLELPTCMQDYTEPSDVGVGRDASVGAADAADVGSDAERASNSAAGGCGAATLLAAGPSPHGLILAALFFFIRTRRRGIGISKH